MQTKIIAGWIIFFCILILALTNINIVQADDTSEEKQTRTELTPLVERYIMDELKSLRTELERMRSQLNIEISNKELRLASHAMEYSTNTVTFFFYVFAILGTGLAILGWRSFADMRTSMVGIAEKQLEKLSLEYEARLTKLEKELKDKGTIIIENQREIEKTQKIHALWLQANQTPDARTKINFYDQILELDPYDYETMAYKADAALQLGDNEWALSVCNRIIDENNDNALAYYFRACAQSNLENIEAAIEDLKTALNLSPGLSEHAIKEEDFSNLNKLSEFRSMIS